MIQADSVRHITLILNIVRYISPNFEGLFSDLFISLLPTIVQRKAQQSQRSKALGCAYSNTTVISTGTKERIYLPSEDLT